MKVPEEIRAVPRPANSVVIDRGPQYGAYRYLVQARVSDGYKRNIVIGYIIDHKLVPFVPIEFSFSFGGAAFACSVSEGIHRDLVSAFGKQTGDMLYALGITRAVKPYLPSDRIAAFYTNSYTGKVFPGIDMAPENIQATAGLITAEGISEYYTQKNCQGIRDMEIPFFNEGVCLKLVFPYSHDTDEIMGLPSAETGKIKSRGAQRADPYLPVFVTTLKSFPPVPGGDQPAEACGFIDAVSLSIVMKMIRAVKMSGLGDSASFEDIVETLNACCKDYKTTAEEMSADSHWSWLPTNGTEYINALNFTSEIRKRRRVPWRKKDASGPAGSDN